MTIERLAPKALPPLPVHQAAAVRAAGFFFPSGLMAVGADGRLAGATIKRQAQVILDNLSRACAEAGTSLDRIVKAQVFLADVADRVPFDQAWREGFPTPPPRTTVATHGLLVEGARVLVDVVGALDRTHPLVFLPAQSATDARGLAREARPEGRRWISPIKAQTAYALREITRKLAAAGSSLDHVVKAQVFLRDLSDFPHFDEVWKEFFATPPPRTTVGVTALPGPETLVAIDLIAITTDGPWRREVIPIPPGVPAPMANYAVGVKAGPFVFAAGQIASDYRTGVAPEARVPDAFPYYGIPIKRQARYVLDNIRRVLEAGGASLARTVKAQVFLQDFADFPAVEEVWREYFPEPVPRTVVGTTGLLVPGTRIEIDLTAVAG